jgi:hypothetical protein
MERIKRFFWDETATAEATSTVVMIAAVGLVLAGGLFLYYSGLNNFFNTVGTGAETAAKGFEWSGS